MRDKWPSLLFTSQLGNKFWWVAAGAPRPCRECTAEAAACRGCRRRGPARPGLPHAVLKAFPSPVKHAGARWRAAPSTTRPLSCRCALACTLLGTQAHGGGRRRAGPTMFPQALQTLIHPTPPLPPWRAPTQVHGGGRRRHRAGPRHERPGPEAAGEAAGFAGRWFWHDEAMHCVWQSGPGAAGGCPLCVLLVLPLAWHPPDPPRRAGGSACAAARPRAVRSRAHPWAPPQVLCDGRPVALPPGMEGLLVLNISSFMGGVDLW